MTHGKRASLLSVIVLLAALPLRAGTPRIVSNGQWTSGAVAYTYDGSGNVSQIGTDQYRYDGAGRLVSGMTNGVTQTYTYDVYGNRTNCTEGSTDCQTATIDSATNRISGATHDAAGNVIAWDGHAYTYDAVRMMASDAAGGTTRQYLYTADDERIAVSHDGTWWQWTLRGPDGKVLREFTSTDGTAGMGTWTWVRDSIWRDGLLLASKQKLGNAVTTYAYPPRPPWQPARRHDSRGSDRRRPRLQALRHRSLRRHERAAGDLAPLHGPRA